MRYRKTGTSFGVLILIATSVSSMAALANDAAFFEQRSQNAYNAVFGLPTVAPRFVPTTEWQFSIEHSNQYAGGIAGDERLLLDGETSRFSLRHRRRIGSCWQLESTLPFVSHTGGVFDNSIDSWHKFFGFPDAERDANAFDNLSYFYSNDTGDKHVIRQPQSGVGDIRLAVQRSLSCEAIENSISGENIVRAGIKLPTGNPNELRGSGKVDVFMDWQSPVWHLRHRVRTGMALGVLVNGQTERFAPQRPVVVYGSLGAQIIAYQKLRLIVQIDAHSGFYQSQLRELGSPAVNLATGLRYLFGTDYSIELSISEDLAIDTTPDIVARLALTYRPDQDRRVSISF